MKLTYRGISYDVNPAVTATAAVKHAPVVDLHYRGATYRRSQVAQNQALDALVMQRAAVNASVPVVDLIYRGATYRRQQAAPVQALDAIVTARTAPTTTSVPERARLLMIQRQRSATNRQQSMLNRSAAEVGANIAGYWNPA